MGYYDPNNGYDQLKYMVDFGKSWASFKIWGLDQFVTDQTESYASVYGFSDFRTSHRCS